MPSKPPIFTPHAAKRHEPPRLNSYRRGYNRAWQATRLAFLREHPFCVVCEAIGRLVPAAEVDHIIAHKGDDVLMWDIGNLQALCRPCHSAKTAREDGGFGRKRKDGG